MGIFSNDSHGNSKEILTLIPGETQFITIRYSIGNVAPCTVMVAMNWKIALHVKGNTVHVEYCYFNQGLYICFCINLINHNVMHNVICTCPHQAHKSLMV